MKKIILGFMLVMTAAIVIACSKPAVTVTFVTNGGNPIESQVLEQGSEIKEVNPVRTGHTFAGWFEDLELTKPVPENFLVYRNISIYANWTINQYKVIFNIADDNLVTFEQDYNTTFTAPEDPEKEGHDFVGWFEDKALTKEFRSNRIQGKDINLYPKFVADSFEVKFMVKETEILTTAVIYGNKVTSIPGVPLLEGHDGAWNIDVRNLEIKADTVVTAVYTIKTFKVDFVDTNGNTIHPSQTVEYNKKVVIPEVPTKEGAIFREYSEDLNNLVIKENKTITVYFDQNSYSVTFFGFQNKNLKTYSVNHGQNAIAPEAPVEAGYTFSAWDKAFNNITATLEVRAIYTPNTYTVTLMNGENEQTVSGLYGSTVSLPQMTKDGYKFEGWKKEGSQTLYTSAITMPLDGIVLTSVFTEINYQITYPNLAGLASNNESNYNIETPTFLLADPQEKVGYTFIGWKYNLEDTTFVEEITQGSFGAITLYAIYEADDVVITFMVDGVPETLTISYDSVISQDQVPAIPTKTHYDQTAPTWDIIPFNYVVKGNKTFTAVYTKNTYTITLNALNSTENKTISGKYNDSITTLETPTHPSKNFGGWYIDEELTTEFEQSVFLGNLTLYAAWTDFARINYQTNGGSTINPLSRAEGTSITLSNATTKEGYTFAGWYMNEELTNAANITQMPATDVTIYAKWTPKDYTIIFMIDGTSKSVILPYDSLIEEDHLPNIPQKPNYNQTAPTWDLDPVNYVVKGDKTFTLVYTPNTLIVTLDYKDGRIISDQVSVLYLQKINQGDIVVPTRDGFYFVRWYQDENLATRYDFNTVVESDITLYAQWERLFYTVEVESIFITPDLSNEQIKTEATHEKFLISNLYYQQSVNVIRSYEGYDFEKIMYGNDTFDNIEDLINVVGNMLDANRVKVYYTRTILEITFIERIKGTNNEYTETMKTFKVYYGESFTNVPTVTPMTGYDVIWERNLFENVQHDITVNAQYYPQGSINIRFIDEGSILYIAVKEDSNEAINGDSILWNITKEGYKFIGWFTANNETGVEVPKGVIYFGETSQILHARWTKLESFGKPNTIEVDVEETTLTISWVMNPALINLLHPKSFIITVNYNEVIVDIADVALINSTYVLIINLSDYRSEYEDLVTLSKAGTHSISVKAIGDDLNTYDSDQSEITTTSKNSQLDDVPSDVAVYENFIIETFIKNGKVTKRYVFYPGLQYQFSTSYLFEIISGQEYAGAEDNILITKELTGEFRFRMTKGSEAPVVYDAIIVESANQFNYGNNYENYLNRTNENSTFISKDVNTPYYVGTDNYFYFDLRMMNARGSRITLNQISLVYEFFIYENESEAPLLNVQLEEYVTFGSNNQFKMSTYAANKRFKVIVSPKYQTLARQVEPLTFEFTVVRGTNIFTNTQLQENYADMDVQTLIIHANIQATLRNDQKNLDGSPKNNHLSGNEANGNVYQRVDSGMNNDNLVIHGNYMQINGTNLPYINKNSGLGPLGYNPLVDIMNVQIGLFYYNVYELNKINTPAVYVSHNGAPTEQILVDAIVQNDNKFTINNLIIVGNTKTPYVNYAGSTEEILVQESLMTRNSGGYLGIKNMNGSLDLNNVQMGSTLIPLSIGLSGVKENGERVAATLDKVRLYDSWANSVYMTGTPKVEVKNSVILSSGGASFHMVDRNRGNDVNDPLLVLHESTVITNFISGEEAWFKAHGMSSQAIQLKSGIQSGIAATGRSIINKVKNPVSGLESEMINLIVLTEPAESAMTFEKYKDVDQIGASTVAIHFVDNQGNIRVINRGWNHLQADARAQGGSFAYPVGNQSQLGDFGTLVTEIATLTSNPGGAASLAMLASFYNLNAQQVITMYQTAGGNPANYNQALANLNYSAPRAKYLEVVTAIPLFSYGTSSVIIELFN